MPYNHSKTNIKYGYGKSFGDVLSDDEGMANLRNPGENLAWFIKNETSGM